MVPLSQKKKKSTIISLKSDLFLFFNFLLQYLEFHIGHQYFILLGVESGIFVSGLISVQGSNIFKEVN